MKSLLVKIRNNLREISNEWKQDISQYSLSLAFTRFMGTMFRIFRLNSVSTLFLNKKNNYFLSSCINQAKYLNDIYAKTANTIRLITVRDKKTNSIKVLHAVQRIGVKETIPVDNGSKGGLIAKIDLETGKLSAARSLHNNKIYQTHPDSNNQIEGVIIPNFAKIKAEVSSVMEKLPYLYFIAWDLLVTDKGVYVLEANSSSGVNIIQVFGGERDKKLGSFYREHKIIK